MSTFEIEKYLNDIKKNYINFCKSKDEQSLFYIYQMIDLFYNELLEEFKNTTNLYSLVYSLYKKNISIIFSNLQEYSSNISDNAIQNINNVINLSISNKYLNMNSINGVFVAFSNELNNSFNLEKKINTLVTTNTNTFMESLFSKMTIIEKTNILKAVKKYQDIISKEMINNIYSKKDNLLRLYKEFLDNVMINSYDKKDEVKEKNLAMITEVTYLYLKDMEYININKYTNINENHIKETMNLFEKELIDAKIIKKRSRTNVLKDYLLSFNNTIAIKAKKIFDEMNNVVYLDKQELNNSMKKFGDIITHIFEKDIIFDKQFENLRKEYGITGRDIEKYNQLAKIKNRALTEVIKANIFNIFRENNKIYNDIIYKFLMLQNKVDDFGVILTSDKIKELLEDK